MEREQWSVIERKQAAEPRKREAVQEGEEFWERKGADKEQSQGAEECAPETLQRPGPGKAARFRAPS